MDQLDKQELMKEHRSIHDLINQLITKCDISHSAIKSMRSRAKHSANEVVDKGRNSNYHYRNQMDLSTQIGRREKLMKYNTSNIGLNTYGDSKIHAEDVGNLRLRANWRHILELVQSQMMRQECLIKVVNEYLSIDMTQAKADNGAVEAHSCYRRISTNLPYSWNLTVKGEKGKSRMIIRWKQGEDSYYDSSAAGYVKYTSHTPTITYYIDETYMDIINKYGIGTTDIAGKRVFTTKAELITGHELEADDVKLFKAMVGYTKVPLDFDTYRGKNLGDKKKIRGCIYHEERWIAVQELPDGKRQMATGKDKSWAIRTMKQRMKTQMLKMMDIL